MEEDLVKKCLNNIKEEGKPKFWAYNGLENVCGLSYLNIDNPTKQDALRMIDKLDCPYVGNVYHRVMNMDGYCLSCNYEVRKK